MTVVGAMPVVARARRKSVSADAVSRWSRNRTSSTWSCSWIARHRERFPCLHLGRRALRRHPTSDRIAGGVAGHPPPGGGRRSAPGVHPAEDGALRAGMLTRGTQRHHAPTVSAADDGANSLFELDMDNPKAHRLLDDRTQRSSGGPILADVARPWPPSVLRLGDGRRLVQDELYLVRHVLEEAGVVLHLGAHRLSHLVVDHLLHVRR
jgi:hypothetical protein